MMFKIPYSKFILPPLLVAVVALVWLKTKNVDRPPSSTAQTPTVSRSSRVTPTLDPAKKWQALANDLLPVDERMTLAKSIDIDLTPAEIDYLLKILSRTPNDSSRENWWLVMNEIMGGLHEKNIAPAKLTPTFIALIKDPAQSEVTRDYAVQHLSLWIAPPSAGNPSESSPSAVTAAIETIAATITDPSLAHTTIPGTSLMALVIASDALPATTTAAVWEKLDTPLSSILLGDTFATLATRTTIIQALALRGSTSQLPLIRTLARDKKINPSLRLSSIAALGIYRSEEDRHYLTEIAEGSTRYRYAAQSALKKLPKNEGL